MGKKQHSKDRLYLTTKEWKHEWGGHRGPKIVPFSKLPFYCCAITFTPFDDPVCSPDGCVFDIVNAVPYLQKFHRHPVSGEPLEVKDLIQLQFHKNADGEYHCPVLNKVFTEHTHIVAVKTSGHVYCHEAISELNIKAKSWKDLLTDEPFTRKDILHIQDPLNFQNKVIRDFEHMKKQLTTDDPSEEDGASLRNVSDDTRRVLETLGTSTAKAAFESGGGGKAMEARRILAAEKNKKAVQKDTDGKPKSTVGSGGDWKLQAPKRDKVIKFKPGANTWDTDDYTNPEDPSKKRKRSLQDTISNPTAFDPNGGKGNPKEAYEPNVKYETAVETTGGMSRSFTSTVMNPQTKNPKVLVPIRVRPTKKGYVKIHTNVGDMNIELYCNIVPRTCENFLGLCEMGYYNGVAFHRSIKNFMVQGGDPTGTGNGGESIYGPTFKDEVDSRLKHSGRGIVSMANSGPHTNGSQFFILYKSAHHLDLKHSVFGKVVGGFDALAAMEKIETNDEDRPMQELRINQITVYINPYKELDEEEKRKQEEKQKEAELEDDKGLWFTDPGAAKRTELSKEGSKVKQESGVGKYLQLPSAKTLDFEGEGTLNDVVQKAHKEKKLKTETKKAKNYGNFNSW